ncbi:Nucleolar GTP-binding protein 1, partial [Coemansia sp. RSA 2399]
STAARISKKRGRSESRDPAVLLARSSSVAARAVSVIRDRSTMGLRDAQQRLSANKKRVIAQRRLAHTGKAGEADRAIGTKMPKHLFSGKRGIGSTNRR